VHDPDEPWIRWNARGLDALDEPEVSPGYRLTTMAATPDVPARVAVHRAAFHPSRVTEESYARVMAEWPYRPELDCAVVAPDGSFAAFALGWLDAANRTGILEPVGTHPDHRRRGLARAACLFTLRQLRAAGAEIGLVGSRGGPRVSGTDAAVRVDRIPRADALADVYEVVEPVYRSEYRTYSTPGGYGFRVAAIALPSPEFAVTRNASGSGFAFTFSVRLGFSFFISANAS
jgi:GNAT superfamily N-acetyltransferase